MQPSPRLQNLTEQEITTREDIENYMGVSRSSRKSREGGEKAYDTNVNWKNGRQALHLS
jgi:hypothetical protein